MSPWKPDSKTVWKKECNNCGNGVEKDFEIINRCVRCKKCGSVYDGVAEKAEKSVYDSQKK